MSISITHRPASNISEPNNALAENFYLGDWLVQPGLNSLAHSHNDSRRQLEPRLIHLLCYLAANSERVLSREALVQELWPNVIVNENSLTRAISELRKHLSCHPAPHRSYVETIPKKGYRLAPNLRLSRYPSTTRWPNLLSGLSWQHRASITALCFALVAGAWLGVDYMGQLPSKDLTPVLLADEAVGDEPEFFGAQLSMSTMDNPEIVTKTIEAPVVSKDKSEYAYIQYDNTGSTIFVGSLDEMTEPVAIFNSSERLTNLTWSPIARALLFARKSTITTAALFSPEQENAELIMLDLDTFEFHRLIQEIGSSESEASTKLNLT